MTDRSEFDMSGWMQLIGEVQQLGLETARNVAARFASMAETGMRGGGAGTNPLDAALEMWNSMVEPASDTETQERVSAAAQSMSDAVVAMMRMGWDLWSRAAQGFNLLSWPAVADLGSAAAGATASGLAYVNIGWSDAPDAVALRAGELTAASGVSIPVAAIRLDPAVIDRPEAGKTYPIEIEVTVPEEVSPGSYHGHLFVRMEPPSALPMRLTVTGG